jgi:hypothetical protein
VNLFLLLHEIEQTSLVIDIIPVTLTIQVHIIPGLEPRILTELLSSTEKVTIVPLAFELRGCTLLVHAESQGGNIVMDQEILPLEPGPIQLSFTSSNSSNPGGDW